jgi:hypothetical protein
VNTPTRNENETDSNPHDGTSVFVKATLTAGDILYIPAGWWHYVESDPFSVMLNFWCFGGGQAKLGTQAMIVHALPFCLVQNRMLRSRFLPSSSRMASRIRNSNSFFVPETLRLQERHNSFKKYFFFQIRDPLSVTPHLPILRCAFL